MVGQDGDIMEPNYIDYGRYGDLRVGQRVSYREAQAEIERHGECMADFVEGHGVQRDYLAITVLEWLGW